MISPSQRPLPDNTQHSQHTNIQALGGIRTYDCSRRAAVDLRHWDRHYTHISNQTELSSQGNDYLCLGSGYTKWINSVLYRLY